MAFDLAGGEAGRPCGAHRAAFDLALGGPARHHRPCRRGRRRRVDRRGDRTCHAERIGHGTRLYEDPGLRDYVRDRRIPLEINITSNVQTHAVARAADHPVRDYFDAGLA